MEAPYLSCGSFDRVTDTVWFNNELNVGSATSVSQPHATSSSIPGCVLET